MTSAIDAALAAAQTEADKIPENTAAPQGGAVATAAPQAGLPAAGGAPTRSLMDVMATAAMNVDFYLRVSELGILLGKDKKVHEELIVEVCLKNAKAGWVIRVNTPGAGVRYLNSYDGVTEARSRQNWSAVVADAQRMDGNAYVSDLIELPVKLVGDYDRKEGGPAQDGTIVGLSLSYMGFKAFGAFLQEVVPVYGENTPFKVKLTAVAKRGGGQDYGVFGFQVVEDAPAKGGKKAA